MQPGMKIVHRAQPGWGIGEVVALQEEGRYLVARFSGRGAATILLSAKDPAVVRWRFSPGDDVGLVGGAKGRVLEGHESRAKVLYRYTIELADGGKQDFPEDQLTARPPKAGALEQLCLGRGGDPESFLLRQRAVRLDLERRADALGALFGSRVMPKPHQVAVVQRVLSARAPRFVLADEVGLGKTIEAGMVYAALAQTGLARRVLVVAPAHLTVQWLAELYHKFHSLFTLVDGERIAKEELDDPRPIWWRYPKIITSLELLARSEEHREAIGAAEAEWDLVIFDEAHHLAQGKAYAAAEAAADNTYGLLLLTATPLQLDPEEHFKLQLLVDPAAPESFKAFERRMERQGDISQKTRELLGARKADEAGRAAAAIVALLPDDPFLATAAKGISKAGAAGAAARQAFLHHLAETYSISSRLIRNRRAVVGGLAARRLVRHDVELSEAELAWRGAVRAEVAAGRMHAQGSALAALLKRIESSPRAAAAALANHRQKELAARASALEGPSKDAKARALVKLVEGVRQSEPAAKFLVFSEARETLDYLRELLGRAGAAAALYHGELTQLERDRQVARFRDPDGPAVLLSTEVGGEGRNFQFCHHLVNYDLAWSPAAIEQRIGRLDRIGQHHEVLVHCFRVEDTLSAHVFDLLAGAVRVFDETVGGLDPVLELVEHDLARLALKDDPEEFTRYQQLLATRVTEAREEVRRAYDPLLDLRSFDANSVRALLERAAVRLGVEVADDEGLEDALLGISRDLDERLEETVISLARRVGIQSDVDEQVDAFQCAFRLGGEVGVDALPGLELEKGDRTMLGSFWRDTAVVEEENDYFGTGHPLVEALFSWVRDGELGRAAWIESELVRSATVGFAFTFLVAFPEAEDLASGSRVPSRQAARYLETQRLSVAVECTRGGGTPKVRAALLAALEEEEPEAGRPPSLPRADLTNLVNGAYATAKAEAERLLAAEVAAAAARLAAERDTAIERLALGGLRADDEEKALLDMEADRLREFHDVCAGALRAAKLELDQGVGLTPA